MSVIIDPHAHQSLYVLDKKNIDSNYLYYDELNYAINKISEYGEKTEMTNILAVIGERGYGKTSFIKTLHNNLGEKFAILDLVDPIIFEQDNESSLGIMEVFLSKLYNKIIDIVNKTPSLNHQLKENYFNSLTSIFSTLSKTHLKISDFYSQSPPYEIVNEFNNRIKIKEKIETHVEYALRIINDVDSDKEVKTIIFSIDDLDLMSTNSINNIINEIQNFMPENVFIITAFKEKKVKDALANRQLREERSVLRYGLTNKEEISKQADAKLTKLISLDMRVRLNQKSINIKQAVTFLNVFVKNNKSYLNEEEIEYLLESNLYFYLKEQDVKSMSLQDFVDKTIKFKLKMSLSYDEKFNENSFIDNMSLRDKLNVISILLFQMRDIQDKESNSYDINTDKLIKNVEYAQNLFMNIYNTKLNNKQYEFILYIVELPSSQLIFNIYNRLYNEIEQNEGNTDSLLDTQYVGVENISIGDLIDIINHESLARLKYFDFMHAIKIMFSLKLCLAFADLIENQQRYFPTCNQNHVDTKNLNSNEGTVENKKGDYRLIKEQKEFYESDYYQLTRFLFFVHSSKMFRSKGNYVASFENKEQYSLLVQNILFTPHTVKGDNTKVIRKKVGQSLPKYESILQYKRRKFFNFDETHFDHYSNRDYDFDLFSKLLKPSFLCTALKNGYPILLSFYTFENFTIAFNVRSTEPRPIKYILNNINKIYREFSETENFNIYSENEISFIESKIRNLDSDNKIEKSQDLDDKVEEAISKIENIDVKQESKENVASFLENSKKFRKREVLRQIVPVIVNNTQEKNILSQLDEITNDLRTKGTQFKSHQQEALKNILIEVIKNAE